MSQLSAPLRLVLRAPAETNITESPIMLVEIGAYRGMKLKLLSSEALGRSGCLVISSIC